MEKDEAKRVIEYLQDRLKMQDIYECCGSVSIYYKDLYISIFKKSQKYEAEVYKKHFPLHDGWAWTNKRFTINELAEFLKRYLPSITAKQEALF